MKLFPFPKNIFSDHGLTYVAGPADSIKDNEACFLKEEQQPGGDWLAYRLSIRRDGEIHSMRVDRHQFLGEVSQGNGDAFVRGLVNWLVGEMETPDHAS